MIEKDLTEELNKLKSLVLSKDSANFELAFQLLKGLGVSEEDFLVFCGLSFDYIKSVGVEIAKDYFTSSLIYLPYLPLYNEPIITYNPNI